MSEKPRAYTPDQVIADDTLSAIDEAWADEAEKEEPEGPQEYRNNYRPGEHVDRGPAYSPTDFTF